MMQGVVGMWWAGLLVVVTVLLVPSEQAIVGELQLRLVGGSSNSMGRVEVRRFSNETWGTVCSDRWDAPDAAVVCRQVNPSYVWGQAIRYSGTFGKGTGSIYLSNTYCRGNETNLGYCESNTWGNTHWMCSHRRDAGVKCYRYRARLVPQRNGFVGATYGTVEVLNSSTYAWMAVCDSNWDDNDARVACKSAGFVDGKALCCGKLSRGYSSYTIAGSLRNIGCTGSETSFDACTSTSSTSRCPSTPGLASAICYPQSRDSVDNSFGVRLNNGSTNWGRVEVKHMGVWGSVCAGRSWNDSAADVTCRQVSGRGGGVVMGTAYRDVFQGSPWVRRVNCTGPETSLEQCIVPPWGNSTTYCNNQYALCYSSAAPAVELVAGDGNSYGRVEMTMDGSRYTVCDNYWSTADAIVVCRAMGYAGGIAIKSSHYGKGSGQVAMDRVGCRGSEDSLWQCRSSGWLKSDQACSAHTQDASVYCHGHVVLRQGDHNNGVVQIITRGMYTTICGTGFGNTEARIVCKDHGFQNGRTLPTGSYGVFRYWGNWKTLSCTGTEASVFNCTMGTGSCQKNGNTNYAAVHCYNGSLDTSRTLTLFGGVGDHANYSGHVRIHQYGIIGRVCSLYWGDQDAKVVCRQLGFNNGMAYGLSSATVGPYLIKEVNCAGTENSLFNCPLGNASCVASNYYAPPDAAVFCYNNDAPQVQLVGGSSNKDGRVEITYGSSSGTVCVWSSSYWSRRAASVVCKSLGYATGSSKQVPGGTGRVALSWPRCNGIESSLLACYNTGFMTPAASGCNDHKNDLGVQCYDEVELKYVIKANNTIIGVPQLFKNNRWNYVCGTFFDNAEAGVICRKMGYNYYRALPAGALGSIYFYSNVVGGLNCTGSESSLGDCPMTVGECQNTNYKNYGAVLCSKTALPQGVVPLDPANQPGEVLVQVDGVQSQVCSDQWDDNDAAVYCQDLGYNFGRAFGGHFRHYSYYTRPVRIVSNISCSGSESAFASCGFSTTTTCSSYTSARVFCFNSWQDFQVRLVGGAVRYEGNVEIGINGKWGSVCDYHYGWTSADANVVCRSLGYKAGNLVTVGTFGPAANPTFLIDPGCTGSEANITSCDMTYFNMSLPIGFWSCNATPASVMCIGETKLQPNKSYGAVEMMVNNNTSSFGLVCADGFGPSEATVTCRDLGYPYGLQMSGSAFGYFWSPRIRRTNLKCTGNEPVLKDCTYSESMDYCPSNKYASVVCSKSSPSAGYGAAVDTVLNYKYGPAKVQHMDYWGYICPNNFNDKDAAVVCRESGYAGGIAYNYYSYSWGQINKIRWLKDIGCSGSESYLARCPNLAWGNVTGCSNYGDAAVFCYETTAPQFRLVNGTRSRGRLELVSDDVTGTVCSRYWGDREASVACTSMGFNGGRFLGSGTFGQGTGDVLVDFVYCGGWEKSLFECFLALKGVYGYTYCNGHQYDAAVQCFNTTRLAGSSLATYGRVEVLVNTTWLAVCDKDFDTNAARVVCRELGYSEARPQLHSALGPLRPWGGYQAARKIGLKVNRCDGSEANLLDCDVTITSTCSTGTYASALCSNQPIQERPLQTKLVETVYGLQRTYLGGVQVNRYGFWGPVCNSSWDDRDANATCHGLGYNYGVSYYGRDWTYKPMVVGNFQCTGRETSLGNCQFGDIDDDLNCSLPLYHYYRKDAGALCYDTPGIGLRLADGGQTYGRLEVQYQGQWGRVADYYWSNTDATIACKQLGFLGGRATPYRQRINHPDRSSKIWMNYVRCYGNERTLFECFNYWDYQTYYSRDANVICNNKVRVTRGNYVSAGVVEVNINNKWGTVCDNQWSDTNTRLTCRKLGFDDGFHVCCGAFGATRYPLMESVQCRNSDTDLTACPHDIPTSHRCAYTSVAVACYKGQKPTSYTYRLNGGPSNNTGEVLINYINITGRICSDGWDNNDAKVFCSELGYPYGQAYEHFLFNSYYYGSVRGPFWTTNVNCQGTESRLRDCQMTIGTVSQCRSGKAAGVLCTNTEGIFYRMGGTDSAVKGRVEVEINGQWGSVCRSYFGWAEATVFCRSQGFNEGRVDYRSGSYPNPPSKIYQANIQCQGNENSLNECPHMGWKEATASYCMHRNDAKVVCFNDVRIGGSYDPTIKQGIVQFYNNGTWYNLCDTGFDDVTAKRVCQDLEFVDGRAVCCSAYGSTSYYVWAYKTHLNYTMHCQGQERSSRECIHKDNNCASKNYASVVCFGPNDYVDESTYTFDFLDPSKKSGVVAVTHMNITGRVCNTDWDDTDARVLCKTKGHLDGLAFHYSQYNYASFRSRGPFWVSSFNCTGNETTLNQCPYQDRLHLGNCSKADLAGAVCFNDSGIQYRISKDVPKKNEGRVEMAVGGVWGTVCRYYWDDRDAKVFCRDQGYSDGYSIRNTFGTTGSGPMWLSYLRCKGTESTLHKCPHSGFKDTPVDDGYYYGCSSHTNDAYVSCVDKLKLNLGYGTPMGAVMVYRNDKWNLICDSGLDHAAAQVVCRQMGYPHGTYVQGGVFGKVKDAQITIASAHCKGTEIDFSKCQLDISTACSSQKYASVVCSNDPIHEETQNVRVIRDDPTEPRHGYLQFQVDGVWGAVCGSTFDSNTASVACKQLGFTGGVPYRPNYWSFKQPILTSDLKCVGTENTLDQCPRSPPPASAKCDYSSSRAGILCYNDTEGISYRLTGDGTSKTQGRFEMKYMGQYGFVCTFYPRSAAKVACKSVGYADGLSITGARFTPPSNEPAWFYSLTCYGKENAIPECYSTGFNTHHWWHHFYNYHCRSGYGPFTVKCFQDQLAITNVRLVDGNTNSSGRVEVFLKGPNQWGTVCDDYWNDVDATVVCNQLGYATGKAVMRAGFGRGKGSIWMDNVGCRGNETRIQDCGFIGFGVHNCLHSEDAGAICSGVYVPPTTTTAKPPPTRTPPSRTTTPKSGGKTDQPVTDKSVGGQGGTNTAAIVAPIVVILVAILAAAVGFVLYRRRQVNNGMKRLDETVLSSSGAASGSVSFGQGGVVKFMNKMRSRGKGESSSGVSNPGYDSQGIVNPSYDSAGGVFATEHADFSSDA